MARHTSVDLSKVSALMKNIKSLSGYRLVVGAPRDSERDDGRISNAALGYIHEHGAPEINIPAHPHLVPGIERAMPRMQKYFEAAYAKALLGQSPLDDLGRAGDVALASVKAIIESRIPPPLKPSTIQRRRARRRAVGMPGRTPTRPLLDTRQYFDSLTWEIRKGNSSASIKRK